jgi:hypothetical protein
LGKYDAKGKIFSSPVALTNGTIICCTIGGFLSFINSEKLIRIITAGKENSLPEEQ